jgi:hypothetical protein
VCANKDYDRGQYRSAGTREESGATHTVGGVVGEAIQKEIERVNEQHAALTRERDRLIAEVEARTLTDDQIENALDFQEAVRLGIENATFDGKLYVLKQLRVKVVAHGDDVTVSCRMPVEPVTIALHSTTAMRRHKHQISHHVLISTVVSPAVLVYTLRQNALKRPLQAPLTQ